MDFASLPRIETIIAASTPRNKTKPKLNNRFSFCALVRHTRYSSIHTDSSITIDIHEIHALTQKLGNHILCPFLPYVTCIYKPINMAEITFLIRPRTLISSLIIIMNDLSSLLNDKRVYSYLSLSNI